VTEGRRNEFAGFPAFRDPDRRARIPDPQADATFLRSRLDPAERERNMDIEQLYRDLLALRRDDSVLRVQDRARTSAATPTADTLAIHRSNGVAYRMLLVNFGGQARLGREQLAADTLPAGSWRLLWWSGDARYGGHGSAPAWEQDGITMPPRSALLLAAESAS
jgi:maltooligosyltrehalose trehalohydrolase